MQDYLCDINKRLCSQIVLCLHVRVWEISGILIIIIAIIIKLNKNTITICALLHRADSIKSPCVKNMFSRLRKITCALHVINMHLNNPHAQFGNAKAKSMT